MAFCVVGARHHIVRRCAEQAAYLLEMAATVAHQLPGAAGCLLARSAAVRTTDMTNRPQATGAEKSAQNLFATRVRRSSRQVHASLARCCASIVWRANRLALKPSMSAISTGTPVSSTSSTCAAAIAPAQTANSTVTALNAEPMVSKRVTGPFPGALADASRKHGLRTNGQRAQPMIGTRALADKKSLHSSSLS